MREPSESPTPSRFDNAPEAATAMPAAPRVTLTVAMVLRLTVAMLLLVEVNAAGRAYAEATRGPRDPCRRCQ